MVGKIIWWCIGKTVVTFINSTFMAYGLDDRTMNKRYEQMRRKCEEERRKRLGDKY